MRRFITFLKKILRINDAKYHIREFFRTINGKQFIQELESDNVGKAQLEINKQLTQELIVDDWLVNYDNLRDRFDFQILTPEMLRERQVYVQLFDEPIEVPFDRYSLKELYNYMHFQVLVASSLTGQLSRLTNEEISLIVISEYNYLGLFRGLSFKVYRVFDYSDFTQNKPINPLVINELAN